MRRFFFLCLFLVSFGIVAAYGFTWGAQEPVDDVGRKSNGTKQENDPSSDNPAKPTQGSVMSSQDKPTAPVQYNRLSASEAEVILHKGTEAKWVGKYTKYKAAGTYICRRCNAPLYESTSKFKSDCGWPSFDDQIEGAVSRHIDADGYRIEITCENCGGHLGHVFEGEGFTAKNVRHCVNSISMKFIPEGKEIPPTIGAKTPQPEADEDLQPQPLEADGSNQAPSEPVDVKDKPKTGDEANSGNKDNVPPATGKPSTRDKY